MLFSAALGLTGSEFHRVGAATEKALVPTFVLTLGTTNGLQLDDRSCLGCLAERRMLIKNIKYTVLKGPCTITRFRAN